MTDQCDTTLSSLSEEVERLRGSMSQPAARRACWVTDEMLGLFRNGGGGTVVSGSCDALLKGGHQVSVLYTSIVDRSDPEAARVIDIWAARGVQITFLFDHWPHTDNLTARSHYVHRWLSERHFDIIHFHDFNGSGFSACTAKRMGLAYANTLLCVSNFGTARWAWECMEFYLQSAQDLERDWIERRAIENADVLLCQSRYMANWLCKNHCVIPERTYIQPSIIPATSEYDGPSGRTKDDIREIVFFGRQEVRKGFRVFVAAADELARNYPGLRFTFSGKFSEVDYEHSGAYAISRLGKAPSDLTFLSHLSRDQAISHLKGPDILAVIPSIDENFPGAVVEAVGEGIEFIASNRGGIPEIVHADHHAERLFEPTTSGLVAAVTRVMAERPRRPRLAFDPNVVASAWVDWHSLVPTTADPQEPLACPLVSVCLVHHNRPKLLKMAVDGLLNQTYANFELIVVDDGSDQPDALAYLAKLENTSLPFALRVCRTPDVRLGAARNAGAEVAVGEYLIFVDDDNVPCAQMIETMVKCAQTRDLDIGTCLAYLVTGEGKANTTSAHMTGYYPAGGPVSQGLLNNVFGDANAIVRRKVFLELGGFELTPGVGAEDWDFFARAVLSGYRLEVIPEALYHYRQHSQQLTSRPHSTHRYRERILQSYMRAARRPNPIDLEDALRLYMGRFAGEIERTAGWHNIGPRRAGEYQRQLLPHVNNVAESYRLMMLMCLELGRFRDAARLALHSESPHAHLLRLGDGVSEIYHEGRIAHVQGYHGEGPSPWVPLLPGILSTVRSPTLSNVAPPENVVRYEPDLGKVAVHPIFRRASVAVIEDGFPANNTRLTASAEVAHPDGPEVTFTVMLVDSEAYEQLQNGRVPTLSLARGSVRARPQDGLRRLSLTLKEPMSTSLTIVLVTEAAGGTNFAWAKFGSFKVSS